MEQAIIGLVPQFGGIAILAAFAFIMLKAHLKALEKFNETLANHFRADQKFMDTLNESLVKICNKMDMK